MVKIYKEGNYWEPTYIIRSPLHAHKLLAPSLVTTDPEERLLSYTEYFRNEICSCSQFSNTETGYNSDILPFTEQ